MTSFAPLSEETHEDRRRYLEGHLAEVSCLDCLARVRVHKQSEFHTSIQWDAQSSAHCAELARARAENPHRVPAACGRLSASIRTAVREGRLEIGGTVD
ncbi:hypothetical protein G7072_08090 [Nocardioides sp. HDW12B]|uniref:hypothetical protein n=1 Tax=Nocardioides sp. HDW12B TaxID=2714939 RepID=UPI00140D90D8|nr:hypothetical protein [Nocardioides sp. HDW12B]QIK66317.1 hypothetical protein G7072_08090 [Nocardioides sp. HDW12B]